MSFRNRKAFACVMAAMLIATCMMFAIPESSDADMTPVETVVIESDMDDKMPIPEIILQYGAISAEKEHQESMGKDVIIRDNEPKRDDPNEQRFIDDMRHLIGIDDRFDVKYSDDVKNNVKDEPLTKSSEKDGIGMERNAEDPMKHGTQTLVPQNDMAFTISMPAEITAVSTPIEETVADDNAEICDSSEEEIKDAGSSEEDTEGTEPSEEESENGFEVIAVDDISGIDMGFIVDAIELSEKYGVDLGISTVVQTFMDKMSIAVMYSEICSIDNSSKNDSEESEDDESPIIILEEDDDEQTIIPDEPEAIQDLFYTPVATVKVTDTLCSGTDI